MRNEEYHRHTLTPPPPPLKNMCHLFCPDLWTTLICLKILDLFLSGHLI